MGTTLTKPRVKLLVGNLTTEERAALIQSLGVHRNTLLNYMDNPSTAPLGKLEGIRDYINKLYGTTLSLDDILEPVNLGANGTDN